MTDTELRLTRAERHAWQRDGFFVRPDAFRDEELGALREAVECAARCAAAAVRTSYHIDGNRYAEAGATTVQFEHLPDSQTVRVLEPFHHLDERFERLIDDPRLVVPMRDLIGSEFIALFTDKLNFKRPREGSRFRWHQDSPYWVLSCGHVDRCPNVMLALDDADEDNGCLRLVPGSHAHGLLPGLEGQGRLGPLFTDPRHFDAQRQVPAVLAAGSLLFFSPHLVHGSEPNRSTRARRALLLTYQPGGHPMFKMDVCRDVAPAPVLDAARAAARADEGAQDSPG